MTKSGEGYSVVQESAGTETGNKKETDIVYTDDGNENDQQKKVSKETVRKTMFGLIFGLGIAVSWVAATQFTQSTYSDKFNAPFFNIWFSTNWMMLCYPAYIIGAFVLSAEKRKEGFRQLLNEDQMLFGRDGLTWITAFKLTGPFLLMWAVTNYMYVRALGVSSATVVVSLFVTNTAFVYFFSWIFLEEKLSLIPARTISVLMSIAGTVLISYSEGFGSAEIVGILLSLGAAVGAALYKVLFKRLIGSATYGQVSLFLTVLGFLNLAFLWPIQLILYFTGQEFFDEMPWFYLCGSAALGLVFNFLVNFGIAVTYPLLISIGHILGIPLNGVVDSTFRGANLELVKICASLLIVVGFFVMITPDSLQEKIACCFKRKEDGKKKLDNEEVGEAEGLQKTSSETQV